MPTKQETLLGRGARAESRRVREPRRTALPCGSQFHGDGISFWVVLGQSFWLRVLPGGARIAQSRWLPARRILGGGRTRCISSWPFLSTSGWWWLVSTVFLSRTSYHKITHTNGYYGACPEWVVTTLICLLLQVKQTYTGTTDLVRMSRAANSSMTYCLAALSERHFPWN